jgi:hypothetical protein
MRRLAERGAHAILCAALALSLGCGRQRTAQVGTVEEEDQQLVSMLHVADPNTAIQLVRGFHDIEQNAWRWTRGSFSVALKVPAGASERGAVLELKFVAPEPVIERLKEVTLSASVNGHALEAETYSKAGEYTYRRELPAAALQQEAVTVDFALDKYLAAGEVETRELGIIVSSAGLIGK